MEKKLKILMLEDNQDDVVLIERILQKDNLSFITTCVDTRDEFNEAIKSFQPDVVLSDHGLPQFNSIEALKICLKECAFTPFILVTGTVSEDFAITCLNQGADDYILKSNLSRLPSAIRRAVKERKLEILKREARRALRRQNDELSKVNDELDNFVYSVSHNLRAPLTSVLGLLSLAELENKDENVEIFHEMMRTSILRLDETLKEILDYSRNVRRDVESEKIDFELLIKTTIDNLSYLDNNNTIAWRITVDNRMVFFNDAKRLGQIFNNIISNSIIYRDQNKKAAIGIEVSGDNDQVIVTIADNGIGIEEEILPKVFNMFYRGTEKSDGAGLGLYITREIVKKLNGQLEINSIKGRGTTVSITMPNNKMGK
jgi:signal transduction histidine kinase